ncbi:MAG: hypothetical protein ACRDRJ_44710 [Streptosporangiaceae bacterium]
MRNRTALLAAMGADNIGSGLFLPLVLVYVIRDVGLPAGTVIAVGTLAGLCVPPVAGRWVDRIGPRPVVIAAEVIQAAGALVYLAARGAGPGRPCSPCTSKPPCHTSPECHSPDPPIREASSWLLLSRRSGVVVVATTTLPTRGATPPAPYVTLVNRTFTPLRRARPARASGAGRAGPRGDQRAKPA